MVNSLLVEAFTLLSFRTYLSQYKKETKAVTWTENTNQSLINYFWCVNNPIKYEGYSKDSWGLTASYSVTFYLVSIPGKTNDLGAIPPTVAGSSLSYTTDYSLAALKYGNCNWESFGFSNVFCRIGKRYLQQHQTIDQVPISMMIKDHRTDFLWNLFMVRYD